MIPPPIGLLPRWLVAEQRIVEIESAIARYEQVGLPVPPEWREELADLGTYLRTRGQSS